MRKAQDSELEVLEGDHTDPLSLAVSLNIMSGNGVLVRVMEPTDKRAGVKTQDNYNLHCCEDG